MRYAEVAENVKQLIRELPSEAEFIFAFLSAFGTPKASIARLRSGQMNLTEVDNELLLKKKLYFKACQSDLFEELEKLKAAKGTRSNDPRFLLVTDFEQLVAWDRKKEESLDCKLSEFGSHFDFFLPLAGMERHKLSNENPADIKAAERMAKLFDAIKAHNSEFIERNPHAMNVFLARLLFCFFAEDTGIFAENAVSSAIATETSPDASDLHDFFVKLFDLLDRRPREGLSKPWSEFPYVNGGLFKDHFPIPEFSMKARRMMLDAGSLDWSDINPDIFGSMFQAVIDPEERHNLGQHYTSVTNIMKVIEPLFLNNFREAYEKASSLKRGKATALHRLLDRISKVKIFDPACGSGNFLIIAYKELRRLEMDIFRELQRENGELPLSRLNVSQFYGIEIADFAAETAVLALWLAEHQMNVESKNIFGQAPDNLPLKEGAHILCENACRIDWGLVCPKEKEDEIYVLGNPPYLGARNQNPEQKRDVERAFSGSKEFKDSDYVTCWFLAASKYIQNANASVAFVATNSISQGEQVGFLWPRVFEKDLEIGFAHKSFKWTNSAKGNAGVTCVIVGIRNLSDSPKYIFNEGISRPAQNISPYLTEGGNSCVHTCSDPKSISAKLVMGNMARDGGNLILSDREMKDLVASYPSSKPYIRRLLGAQEFIKGIDRWCLWITDEDLDQAKRIKPIAERIQRVYEFRKNSPAKTTQGYATIPHMLAQRSHKETDSIIIPSTTSERREYIPMGFVGHDVIATNAMHVIYDANPVIFGLLTSRMHMAWVRAVAGRLEERLRYSAGLCYNTFPVPVLNESKKLHITELVMNVLQERENHPEKTMAQLYDPDKMPEGLRSAHQALDQAVEQLYRKQPFATDEERLEHLFKRYETMIEMEKEPAI